MVSVSLELHRWLASSRQHSASWISVDRASKHAEALDLLAALCERDEAECLAAIHCDDESLDAFAEFTRRSYGTNSNEWERLFSADIYDKRLAWLEANEARVRAIVGSRLDA
jgi:hypothetical protein